MKLLTAKLADGNIISLANNYEHTFLLALRKKETFLCPCCNKNLTLKLGKKRIWHFAHAPHSPCPVETEHESPYHLQGKYQLYHWFKQQGIRVMLEPYLKNIQQRPDLLIKNNQETYAIEFQCATIPVELLVQRTNGYNKAGIKSLWIFGGNRVKRLSSDMYSIHRLEWAAIRKKENPVIIYYCSNKKQFLTLAPYYAIGPTKAYVRTSFSSLTNTSFFSWPKLNQNGEKTATLLATKSFWRNSIYPRPSKLQLYINRMLELKNKSIRLFPSEAGWPTKYHYLVESPTYLWQTWVLLGFLQFRPIGEPFSFHLLKNSFSTVVGTKLIEIRTLALPNIDISMALKGYLYFLAVLGVIKFERTGLIRRVKDIEMPSNDQEASLRDQKILAAFLRCIKP